MFTPLTIPFPVPWFPLTPQGTEKETSIGKSGEWILYPLFSLLQSSIGYIISSGPNTVSLGIAVVTLQGARGHCLEDNLGLEKLKHECTYNEAVRTQHG